MKWDVFISHASEDKKSFVEPLAKSLRDEHYRVWYDEFSMSPGDSLRRSIDTGLAESAAGLVVLSPNFFEKEWPQRELDALTTQEISGKKRVIPIWHGIDRDFVSRYSPLLADKVAILSTIGVPTIVDKLKSILDREYRVSGTEVERCIAQYLDETVEVQRFLRQRCLLNLYKLLGCMNVSDRTLDEFVNDIRDDVEDLNDDQDQLLRQKLATIRETFQIPNDAYAEFSGSIGASELADLRRRLIKWCNGILSNKECRTLFYDLDERWDLDYLFVFFAIPNFSVSPVHRQYLDDAVVRIGSRKR